MSLVQISQFVRMIVEGELPFSYHLAIQARILSSIEGRDICDVQNDEFLLGETERD